jgi:Lrp/AsnC family leucine-responsive transcriptional regulator
LVPSATLERVKRLEKLGVISGYHASINTALLDYNLLAFVNLKANTDIPSAQIIKHLEAYEQVQELHHVAGDDCYMLKIRARNVPQFSKFLHNVILKIEGVRDSKSVIVMETSKETMALPLEDIFNEN